MKKGGSSDVFRRLPILALCAWSLVSSPPARAEGEGTVLEPAPEIHLFAGGLMFHLTPVQITGIPDVELGVAGGVGGGMQFYLGRHLRLGGMGSSGSMKFGEHESPYRATMGAFTAVGAIPLGPVDLDLGVALGGQKIVVHHYRDELPGGGYDVDRIEREAFVLLPSLALEIPLIRRLRILVLAHYYHPHWQDEFTGHTVTIHLGLWFNTYVRPKAK